MTVFGLRFHHIYQNVNMKTAFNLNQMIRLKDIILVFKNVLSKMLCIQRSMVQSGTSYVNRCHLGLKRRIKPSRSTSDRAHCKKKYRHCDQSEFRHYFALFVFAKKLKIFYIFFNVDHTECHKFARIKPFKKTPEFLKSNYYWNWLLWISCDYKWISQIS